MGNILNMQIIFESPIGSRLHGLSNETSDYDLWTIIDSFDDGFSKLKHDVKTDHYTVPLDVLLNHAESGHHVALDVMFSPLATSSWFDAYRAAYRAGAVSMHNQYLSTIQSGLFVAERSKHRRHALRLALNYRESLGKGRFNPVLSADYASMVSEKSRSYDFLDVLEEIWPYDELGITLEHRKIVAEFIERDEF